MPFSTSEDNPLKRVFNARISMCRQRKLPFLCWKDQVEEKLRSSVVACYWRKGVQGQVKVGVKGSRNLTYDMGKSIKIRKISGVQ